MCNTSTPIHQYKSRRKQQQCFIALWRTVKFEKILTISIPLHIKLLISIYTWHQYELPNRHHWTPWGLGLLIKCTLTYSIRCDWQVIVDNNSSCSTLVRVPCIQNGTTKSISPKGDIRLLLHSEQKRTDLELPPLMS